MVARVDGIVREVGRDRYTPLYLKRIINKDLLYSTGNSAQRYVAARMEGEFGGEYICICMAESLHHSPEIITTLLISYTPIQNKMFVCCKDILTKATRPCWRWRVEEEWANAQIHTNQSKQRMAGPGGRGPTFQISPLPFPRWGGLAKLLNLSQHPIPRVIFFVCPSLAPLPLWRTALPHPLEDLTSQPVTRHKDSLVTRHS